MFRIILMAVTFMNAFIAAPVTPLQQAGKVVKEYTRADFVNIEGASLNDKIARAVAQHKAAKLGDSCWLAWHYPVRTTADPGTFRGLYYRDDDGIRMERREDPKLTAVFLLAETNGAQPVFKRVKTLNLGEPYIFENRPVYWLGDNEASQSLAQLETLHSATDMVLARGALRAISYHDSPRAVAVLKETASKTTNEEMRRSALSGLGNLKASEADAALIDLFEQSADEAFKEEVIRRLGYSESRAALDKLQALATRETSARLRKAAVRQLTRTASNSSVFDGDFEWRQDED